MKIKTAKNKNEKNGEIHNINISEIWLFKNVVYQLILLYIKLMVSLTLLLIIPKLSFLLVLSFIQNPNLLLFGLSDVNNWNILVILSCNDVPFFLLVRYSFINVLSFIIFIMIVSFSAFSEVFRQFLSKILAMRWRLHHRLWRWKHMC